MNKILKSRFERELEQNIIRKIKKLRSEGTTAMSMSNLKMVTPTPTTCDGAPCGTNAKWLYNELFQDVCRNNKYILRFIL